MIQIDVPMPINCVDCDNREIRPLIGCKLIYSGCANCGRHPDCPLKEVSDKPSGKWEHISYFDGGYGMNETCSNCGCTIHGQIFDLIDKYCPNCGAKMESEDNNDREPTN